MKKRVWSFVCVLVLAWQTAALAEPEWSAAKLQEYFAQCSMEELLQVQDLLAGEMENRGYTADYYVVNKNTQKFHFPDCSSVQQMKEKNRGAFEGDRETLISLGFAPCGNCHP